MREWLERRWYSDEPAPWLLRPLALLFGAVANSRRKRLSAQAEQLPLPVIVVGNISVGGTGKTPFTIWLLEQLQAWGYRPGVLSRGYGGAPPQSPYRVTPASTAAECGDEPLLIASRCGVPVMVDADRVRAAKALIESGEVDVLVADDGLQHYRLARDLEICVVDGRRAFGNGAQMPAGPLREMPKRLDEIPIVVVNGGPLELSHPGRIDMELTTHEAVSIMRKEPRALASFRKSPVHAVVGIGNPSRFFNTLRKADIEFIPHVFPDHHAYRASDIRFEDDLMVLMTEKDATKCQAFADARHYSVPVSARIDAAGVALVQQSCAALKPSNFDA